MQASSVAASRGCERLCRSGGAAAADAADAAEAATASSSSPVRSTAHWSLDGGAAAAPAAPG